MSPSHPHDTGGRHDAGAVARHRTEPRRVDDEFRLLVDAVAEYAIFRLDPEGRVVSWNRGAEVIKGYTADEILGRHVSTFYTEEDVEAAMPEIALEAAAREGQWKKEAWRVRKDGSRFWAHVTIRALYDEAGELRGFAKVTRDMTEQHEREENLERQKRRAEEAKQKAEQAQRRAEQQNALLKLVQTVAMTANDATSLEEAMRETIHTVCAHTGWPVGHVYRLSYNGEPHVMPTGIWGLQRAERFETFRRVTESTSFTLGESLPGRVAEQGEPVWIRDVTEDPNFIRSRLGDELGVRGAFAVPVYHGERLVDVLEFFSPQPEEPDDRLLSAMASVSVQLSRVAERERARQALEESEARFRALAEESPTGITVIQDGRFKYVNKTYAQIYGYEPEEMIDTFPFEEVVHPDDREIVRENLRRRLEGEVEAVHFQVRGWTKSEETINVEVYGQRLIYEGRPAVIGSVLDVTERVRLQRELLRIQEEERRRIGQDLHDGVASRLTGVAILLSTLVKRSATVDEARSLTESIREVQRLVQASCDDVRKLSRGLAPAGLSEGGLPAALERLAGSIEGGVYEQATDLPALDDDAAAHLYWIVQEATTNARKYARANEIAIRLMREDATFVLEIADDGIGFDVSGIEEAEGLGLRTMQYRADLLGATLLIDSAPGAGTRVRCRLPA